ncbi:hypothetical protein M406DRAFT_72768 [Cryphonectria parasitica EP155]|uniref:Uncharacterized protein n=1 Tax=Cryphonectria parasitica (strain ATCC 38755 / EP155) TaxID=660469 RepID=A0A9P5CM11_CRYP1|nr:uncharacterized protein M406DRAFT_72768 [Cryphonectria parasitica EP155]KAF3762782.1 hypothetical protein M406DRAFT_72768 [Cryphonectria parasitica EP155]
MAPQPVTTRSGRDYSTYNNALEYLQDVNELPRFYKDVLQNDWERNERVDRRLQEARVCRPLHWGTKVDPTEPAINRGFTSLKMLSNMLLTSPPPHRQFTVNLPALFVYVTGNAHNEDRACKSARCSGIFATCVTAKVAHQPGLPNTMRTSCAACMYNANNTRCGFNQGH